ncbi:Na+/H+ antiporter subunit E [Shouchella lonarensis]|uniref:Multisubunit sodium/proton antiporter, MrpE subunit n=1 Tax=Shouchella lonarensis TaxID=1464122 RepID=A0A1G6KEL5_9BACI|nr:Na+/H+ antiporter subunit E [Shouchella lonarensis]SDC29542.1 multisubunit sodium/proton antiporter, MrpE subunit [Shouchella lonarensis]
MMFQLAVNFTIAFLWILFQNSLTMADFIVGYAIGMVVVLVLVHFQDGYFYMHRVWSLIKLMGVFLRELTLANIDVMKILLRKNMNISPGIIAVPTELKTNSEKALFALLMTLTPGTLSIEFSKDGTQIFIHALQAENPEDVVAQVKRTFEASILEVTRRHV